MLQMPDTLRRRARLRAVRLFHGAAAVSACLVIASSAQADEPTFLEEVDTARVWAGRKFVDAIDAADMAFGEPRVQDRLEIARAKLGIRAEVRDNMDTTWSIPSNFRIPLPGIERRLKFYIDLTAATDTHNLDDLGAAADESTATISATLLRKFTDTFDLGATLGVHGGPAIGPELFARYDRKWRPWALFGEQRFYWRTDNGWGGRTTFDVDYALGASAFLRWANRAEVYQELHGENLESGLIWRWLPPYGGTAVSLETGVKYNPYHGDPEKAEPTTHNDDPDQTYVQLRMIGKVWRDWIELEVMPGHYYYWQRDEPGVWGVAVRLSLIYESLLGNGR